MIASSNVPTFVTLCFFPLAFAGVEPRPAVWSSAALGPDGPWNAVEVSIGAQPKIALFPGHLWNTFVTTSDYCALNNSVPHCASGSYLKDEAIFGSRVGATQRISYRQPTQDLMAGAVVRGLSGIYLDSIDMLFNTGPIPDHSLTLIESQLFEYPGGTWYPIFTGCLDVGAPHPHRIFTGPPDVNASVIPWALKDQQITPSSSFGLHYGSAVSSAKMPGSLLYGGYDRNRVVGNILSLDGDVDGVSWKPVGLRDISIRVIKGSSPFEPLPSDSSSNTSVITGLLAKGNSSITSTGLPVLLDPCSPYLTLPKSTCDNIASRLPVSYSSSLGLYIWNVSSPRYSRIVSSASALSFTFIGASNTESLTIHVPFRHLNLTLSPPFADPPIPYFPCFTGGTGAYVLGRAFFQDAFIGANWERRKMWLAQAPGPNVPPRVDVVSVQPDQVQIQAGDNNWDRSWDGFWTALTAEEANGTTLADGDVAPRPSGTGDNSPSGIGGTGGGAGQTTAPSSQGGSGLPIGATVGIAVGAAIGVMAVAAGLFFLCRKRRGQGVTPRPEAAVEPLNGTYYRGVKGPVEAPGPQDGVYEMPHDGVYELPHDRMHELPGYDSGGKHGCGQVR